MINLMGSSLALLLSLSLSLSHTHTHTSTQAHTLSTCTHSLSLLDTHFFSRTLVFLVSHTFRFPLATTVCLEEEELSKKDFCHFISNYHFSFRSVIKCPLDYLLDHFSLLFNQVSSFHLFVALHRLYIIEIFINMIG